MRVLPQQDHADLGLLDDDDTEDLRPITERPPMNPVLAHRSGTAHTHKSLEESR